MNRAAQAPRISAVAMRDLDDLDELDASTTDLREGDTVDRYRIGALLGVGGHGVVYAAEHVELGYPVALKVLERHAVADPRRRARFRREALLGARIRHRNIVAILETGELHDCSPYLVMEHVRGVELATLLESEGALDPAAVVDLGLQLCAATAALSEHGILHRDIKPQNVMLARAVDGAVELKLLDFGIVKALRSATNATLTQDGFVLGTPHYMSPEQIRGQQLDVRSDLFAIGAVLYEALTGHPPIDAESTEGVLTKMLIERPTPLLERRPDCPPALAAVVERALEKNRDARYRTPLSMAEALDAARESAKLPLGAGAWRGRSLALAPRQPHDSTRGLARDEPLLRIRWSRLTSSRASERYLPTPAECPSAIRARRRNPRFPPPWWPAVALAIAALIGGWAALGAGGGDPPRKEIAPSTPAMASPP